MLMEANRSENEWECNLGEWFVDLRKLDAIIFLIAEPLFVDHFLENGVLIKALVPTRQPFLAVKTEYIYKQIG